VGPGGFEPPTRCV